MSAGTRLPGTPTPMHLWPGAGGVRIAGDSWGDPAGPLVILQHGGGQTRHAWKGAGETLGAAGYFAVAFDARGHGDSDWAPDGQYGQDVMVEDLECVVAALGGRRPVLVGASMGGLLGLLVEGELPITVFRAMVLVDVTPRWETEGVGKILSFMAQHPEGFDNLEHAADEVARYLPHRERKDPERLRSQLRQYADGRWRWHWDPRLLAHVAAEAERYIPRLQAAATRVQIPVLLLSGGRSDVVSEHTIREFMQLVPHAEHVCIDDATHMVVGDRNDVFTREISRFLQRFDH